MKKGGLPDVRSRRTISLALAFALAMALSVPALGVNLVIWDYVQWRVDYYQSYADEYMALNPGVNIEVQLVAQSEYTSKIQVGMVTGTAPSMFAGHPQWVGLFVNQLAPFPTDLFPPDELTQEVLGYEPLLWDGNAYYYPLGLQGGMLLINQDHWDNAGLAEPPRTWEEALDIGRRGTRRVDGVTQVAGFYFNTGNEMMQDLFTDLNYQYGGRFYRNNGTEVAFDETQALDAVNFLTDMYRSGVSGLPGETLSFFTSQHTMMYSYAWRLQQLALYPDLRWSVAPLPTLTGDFHQNMARMQYYFGLAVPASNPPEEVRAAFEFIAWAYGDDNRLMDLNSRSGTLPTKMSLWSSPEIVDNRVLFTLTQTLPYSTVPGETPDWIFASLAQVRDAIVHQTGDPGVTLREVTRLINTRLKEEPLTWVAE